MLKVKLFILRILFRKEEQIMDVIYATLIINGAINPKTNEPYKFADVPKVIKPRVKSVLEDLGLGELAGE